MQFKRVFTKEGESPYASIEFERRTSEIKEADGTSIFKMDNVEVPKNWSQTATDILVQKYFRKAGVPDQLEIYAPTKDDELNVPLWLRPSHPVRDANFGSETSAKQVFHRLAGTWTYWGWKENYFDTEKDAQIFYDEIIYMLASQMFAPNSPQWFNTGLHWAYGIDGPSQGHYYVDPVTKKTVKAESAYQRPQPHACFIQKIEDHLVEPNGIMDTWLKEARLFKYGSGSGINFSTLRGKGELLEGGGVSSGLMSWLKIGDVAAGGIKSGGTTRRAAKMVVVDVDHPDIEEFIEWKVKEEEKVAALITGSKMNNKILNALLILDEAGNEFQRVLKRARENNIPEAYIQKVYQLKAQGIQTWPLEEFDSDWQGEAYRTVSGQNSNNSINASNLFLDAVRKDSDWELVWRTEQENIEKGKRYHKNAIKKIKARKLWDKITYSAWTSADPGLIFEDTINKYNTCKNDGKIRGVNPCSEYMFLDDTACNLASLNLVKFFKNFIDTPEEYIHACRILTVILDISVSMAQFPSENIATNSYLYRPLGLGYANLGALLMRNGIPYDSSEAEEITRYVTGVMHFTALKTSAELAKDLEPFPRYSANKESMKEVLYLYRNNAAKESRFRKILLHMHDEIMALGHSYGYRNAYVTNIAPTGTIGLVMDCDTTGIEPDFALVKFKKLAGGGYLNIINQSVIPALLKLGYPDHVLGPIEDYLKTHYTIEGAPHLLPEHYAVFDCANKCGSKGERYIRPFGHLRIMQAAQDFLSGGISKTVNLPNDATISDVSVIYLDAWVSGLKAIALYRDGSKLSQPLNTKTTVSVTENLSTSQFQNKSDDIKSVNSRNLLPSKRKGYTQKAKIAGQSLYIRTGEYHTGQLGEIFIDMHREGATVRSLLNSFAIAVSLGLQHGVPLEKFVEAFVFTKFEPSGMVEGHDNIKMASSLIDYIFRDLAINYLNRSDLAHVQSSYLENVPIQKSDTNDTVPISTPQLYGYTGDICPECHNATMVRNGTCLKCVTCGATTGCS